MPDISTVRGQRSNIIYGGYDWATVANSISWSPYTEQKEYKYIKSFSYIPDRFNFHKINNEEDLFMGIELEVDNGGKSDDNAKLIIDTLGEENVYIKHDGSLKDGLEIVTHPCTYEYHQFLPYEILFKELSKLGYRSHDVNTCGLHIHFNRNYFAKDKLNQDLCISKLLYLFEKFWDKVVLIARRDSNTYAKRFFLKEDETILDMYAKSKNSDKYGVINLKHKDTVEIRIFKGTLNYETFINTLEFVKEIVKIIRLIDIYDIQSVTWDYIKQKFSNEFNTYIDEREKIEFEKKNKEVKEILHHNYNSFYTSSFHYDTFQTVSNELSAQWVNLRNSVVNQSLNLSDIQSRDRYNRSQLIDIAIEDMNITQIEFKIKFIKEDMRRANTMEKQMLQRELQLYTNKLGELRRRNSQ